MNTINEDITKELLRTSTLYAKAEYLKRLELFSPARLPEDAYDLWNKLTKSGSLMQKMRKPNESPKITFSRYIKKKRDEYKKLKDEFEKQYNMDYRIIDMDNSNSEHVVGKNGNTIAPILN